MWGHIAELTNHAKFRLSRFKGKSSVPQVAEYHQVLHCMGVFSHTAVETPSFYTHDDDDDENDEQVTHSTLTCCGFAT